jgi:CRP-like cAMP-binding protein
LRARERLLSRRHAGRPERGDRASIITNLLIALLPRPDQRRLIALCETVPLARLAVLADTGASSSYAWFPQRGFVSLREQLPDTPALEVGMVGREGMLGIQHFLGGQMTRLSALVLGAGQALRLGRQPLALEFARSAALRKVLLRYVQRQLAELAHRAACHRFHAISPRLARWLLTAQDRAPGSDLCVTHEILAKALGVRRVGITQAAQGLQRLGLIRCRRGAVQVLDRPGLEQAACPCYAADRAADIAWR